MSPTKTEALSFRVDPSVKEALRIAAEREHRSLANMFEVLIRNHCEQNDIAFPQQGTLFPGQQPSE